MGRSNRVEGNINKMSRLIERVRAAQDEFEQQIASADAAVAAYDDYLRKLEAKRQNEYKQDTADARASGRIIPFDEWLESKAPPMTEEEFIARRTKKVAQLSEAMNRAQAIVGRKKGSLKNITKAEYVRFQHDLATIRDCSRWLNGEEKALGKRLYSFLNEREGSITGMSDTYDEGRVLNASPFSEKWNKMFERYRQGLDDVDKYIKDKAAKSVTTSNTVGLDRGSGSSSKDSSVGSIPGVGDITSIERVGSLRLGDVPEAEAYIVKRNHPSKTYYVTKIDEGDGTPHIEVHELRRNGSDGGTDVYSKNMQDIRDLKHERAEKLKDLRKAYQKAKRKDDVETMAQIEGDIKEVSEPYNKQIDELSRAASKTLGDSAYSLGDMVGYFPTGNFGGVFSVIESNPLGANNKWLYRENVRQAVENARKKQQYSKYIGMNVDDVAAKNDYKLENFLDALDEAGYAVDSGTRLIDTKDSVKNPMLAGKARNKDVLLDKIAAGEQTLLDKPLSTTDRMDRVTDKTVAPKQSRQVAMKAKADRLDSGAEKYAAKFKDQDFVDYMNNQINMAKVQDFTDEDIAELKPDWEQAFYDGGLWEQEYKPKHLKNYYDSARESSHGRDSSKPKPVELNKLIQSSKEKVQGSKRSKSTAESTAESTTESTTAELGDKLLKDMPNVSSTKTETKADGSTVTKTTVQPENKVEEKKPEKKPAEKKPAEKKDTVTLNSNVIGALNRAPGAD